MKDQVENSKCANDTVEILELLSESRLRRFVCSEIPDWNEAVSAYFQNLRVQNHLYPHFHCFEIILRNRMHSVIGVICKDLNWVSKLKYDFDILVPENLLQKQDCRTNLRKTIANAHEKVEQEIRNRHILEGDLVARLDFGFWTTFLNKPYSTLLHDKGLFKNVFSQFCFATPNLVSKKEMQEIRELIHKIRSERNRMFHHEPVKDWQQTILDINKAMNWVSKIAAFKFNSFFGEFSK